MEWVDEVVEGLVHLCGILGFILAFGLWRLRVREKAEAERKRLEAAEFKEKERQEIEANDERMRSHTARQERDGATKA